MLFGDVSEMLRSQGLEIEIRKQTSKREDFVWIYASVSISNISKWRCIHLSKASKTQSEPQSLSLSEMSNMDETITQSMLKHDHFI